jgi:phosphatidylglycerophosphate synthase
MSRTARPALIELRTRVFKHSGSSRPEIGNILARKLGRPSAVYGTWLAVRLGLSAHAVTTLAMAANLAGAVAIGSGFRAGFLGGVLLLIAGYWLDHVDGQVARWRGSASISGVYFDYVLHHVTNLSLGFALGFGLTMKTGSHLWSLCGFAIASGWMVLNLHNDCRYKAMFQRLKAMDRDIRVDRGSKPQPLAPSPWPTRWPGIVTWPMAKACEFHVVLSILTILMVAAAGSARVWLIGWEITAISLAIIAPVLALGRVARSISRGEADAEFHSWFRVL